jgi:hypothetical protein
MDGTVCGEFLELSVFINRHSYAVFQCPPFFLHIILYLYLFSYIYEAAMSKEDLHDGRRVLNQWHQL